MKGVVALILALEVISGCHARAVRQAEPPVQWEKNVERFWTHVSQLNSMADGVEDNVKASQLARELDTLINDTMAELNVYRENIETTLGPYAEDTAGQLSQDMQLRANKLQTDMLDAKERSTQYLGELKSMVEQNADDVRNRVNSYTHKLKKRLGKDKEDIHNTMTTYLSELQSRTTKNAELVKEKVEPLVSQAHEAAGERLDSFSALLKSQTDSLTSQLESEGQGLKTQLESEGQGLKTQLESQGQGLKTQLESTAQELRTTLEGKMDQLTNLLTPFTDKFREQLQTIVDKVKETAA